MTDGSSAEAGRPTKEECLEHFWDIIAEGLVDLHRKGKLRSADEVMADRMSSVPAKE